VPRAREKARLTRTEPRRAPSKATVFLGGGRITSALIAGLRLSGYNHRLVVHDRNPQKLRALRREFRVEVAEDLKSVVAQAEMLIVAVRPRSVAELLEEIRRSGAITRPVLAVSLAAGIPIEKLRARLGPPVRWARAMPSPVCRIARGLTALAFDRQVPQRGRVQVRAFFARVGPVLAIPESRFDIFTAAFSPSHGYHALTALANAAERAGLNPDEALAAAAHALADGILYWREGGEDLAALQLEAATPGGTAAATIAAMERAGYARAVARGLKAGAEQGRRNARGR
jgi:pyrroline-5-carboxylate reductase